MTTVLYGLKKDICLEEQESYLIECVVNFDADDVFRGGLNRNSFSAVDEESFIEDAKI